jgi:hypothetical protein
MSIRFVPPVCSDVKISRGIANGESKAVETCSQVPIRESIANKSKRYRLKVEFHFTKDLQEAVDVHRR